MREIILISFLGPDQPNQFTRLMQVLSVHSLQILDVGQAVIHNQLTLGIVVSSDDQTATALAMKEILILAHDIGLTVRFKPISAAEYDQWVSEGGRTRYIVTALAPELDASHLQAVTKIVSGQGFNLGLRDAWELAEVLLEQHDGDPGAARPLAAYVRNRQLDRRGSMAFTDSIVRLFSNDLPPLRVARGAGLLALDLFPPLRHFVARRMIWGARAWP